MLSDRLPLVSNFFRILSPYGQTPDGVSDSLVIKCGVIIVIIYALKLTVASHISPFVFTQVRRRVDVPARHFQSLFFNSPGAAPHFTTYIDTERLRRSCRKCMRINIKRGSGL
jgi:hypothetical protein